MAKKSKARLQRDMVEQLLGDNPLTDRMEDHLRSGGGFLDEGSPFRDLLSGMVNRVLNAELDVHLAEQAADLGSRPNKRNGTILKTVKSDVGDLTIQTPRDRNGDFEPVLVPKRSRQLNTGLDQQIMALYAQGNTVEDIRRILEKMYGVSISAGKISMITDGVLEELEAWRNRPLAQVYAVLYLDAVHFRVRDPDTGFSSRASYTVYGIDINGNRDILGIYVMESEGAMGWGRILEDLKRRGVEDLFCVCVDGLKGLPDAIRAVYPKAIVQRCIVHMVRQTTRFCNDRDIKAVCKALREIYTASDKAGAALALERFEKQWGQKYPRIVEAWLADWDDLMAFLDFPEGLRRIVYTTNPVEAVHRILRKLLRGKASFPSDKALIKQLYLSLTHNEKSWRRRAFNWKSVQNCLVSYGDKRFAKYLTNTTS